MRSTLGLFGAYWGVFGVLAILGQAIVRLGKLAWEPIDQGAFTWWQWAIWVGWIVAQSYMEGYRGFQKAFCPRVVARAMYLMRNPRWFLVLFAPLYCLSLFFATRSRLIFQYVFLALLVGVILAVHQVPQPWRGLIDAGVVAGLAWGWIAVVVYFAAALRGAEMPVSADLPTSARSTV